MKKVPMLLLITLAVIVLAITMTAVLGGTGDRDYVFFDQGLEEHSGTTYFIAPKDLGTVVTTYTFKDRDIKQQVKESNIIVRGKVLSILSTVETADTIDNVMEERIAQGWKYLHTDVLFQVDEYLGSNSLPFEQLVLRHIGGKIEGKAAHICEQEHLTVGEEVVIFRLAKYDDMTQVPVGYSVGQYFLFQPASKYVSTDGNSFRACFKDETVSLDRIRKACTASK